jgi:hypothetical protein
MAYLSFTFPSSAPAAPSAIPNIRVHRRTVGHTHGVAKIRESLNDPGAAAARGRWLARGAWLLAAAEVVLAVRNHVNTRLSEKDRQRMVEIVKASKGRPSNISDRQRKELKALLNQVEPRELAKTVATSGFASRFTKGLRRK